MAWDRNGVWLHTLTEEEKQQGGIWTIGNNPFDLSPDYPGRNDGSLLVKDWIANPDKYGGEGYAPKDRIHENRWEYVKANEVLQCRVFKDGKTLIYNTHAHADGIDLPPEVRRSWHLPKGCSYASGITICREVIGRPLLPGSGPGYEFVPLIGNTELSQLDILNSPRNLQGWNYLYLQPFEGFIAFKKNNKLYILFPNDIAFVQHTDDFECFPAEANVAGRGMGIFF